MKIKKDLFVNKTIVDIDNYVTVNLGDGLLIKFSDGSTIKIEAWNDIETSDLIIKKLN